ncbi:MAG: MBL fold metallo-hydrolase [Clostridia bacterium]|nr:MBL fold metallo-hydrolase [Clostridia bacterium]
MSTKKKIIYSAILLALFIACCLPYALKNNTTTQQTPSVDIYAADTLAAHFIDVGQADSALIQLPNGETMLIDAGGEVNDYIASLGITKIDYLVATHPHSDHIAYLDEVISEFEVGKVIMPRVNHSSEAYKDLLYAIQKKSLRVKTARAGITLLDTEDLDIDIVAPAGDEYESLNDYSAVIKVTYKNKALLFTGDAEATSENQITADVNADVLKVGHHGSSTSSSKTFLSMVSPEIAVISCGKDNDYGHPHKEVLQALNVRGATTYRTDENGTVVVYCDGENLHVECEKE